MEAEHESELVQVIEGVSLGETSAGAARRIDTLARTDHSALLEYCLKSYDSRYRDYTCTLQKQELIRGALGKPQTIDVSFMNTPFSVAMKWTENAPIGDRVLYIEGKYGNQMLVRPKGLLGKIVGTVKRKPDGPEAMRNTLRPVSMFGFRRGMENLLKVYRQAQKAGDLKEEFGGYAKVGGRDAVCLIRYLPPAKDYPAYITKVYIDTEYLVPICIEAYDWDEQPQARYVYKDVKFNIGLADEDFTPQANEIQVPS